METQDGRFYVFKRHAGIIDPTGRALLLDIVSARKAIGPKNLNSARWARHRQLVQNQAIESPFYLVNSIDY